MKKKTNKSFWEYKGDIYCYNPDKNYYLKVTGWESGEDRRVYKFEIDSSKLVHLKPEKAYAMINKAWNSGVRTWIHDGKTYSNEGEFPRDFGQIPIHAFKHTYVDINGNTKIYYEQYRLVWHQGHIFWCKVYHYFPQLILFRFNGIDGVGKEIFAKWTNVKNCRPIKNSKGEFV